MGRGMRRAKFLPRPPLSEPSCFSIGVALELTSYDFQPLRPHAQP